jgi:quercetin dioxygenase-like cupin family protein
VKAIVFATAIAMTPLMTASALAQQPPIKRTPLGSVDFPEGYTAVTAISEMPGGVCSGRHIHPGVETAYVLEGDVILKVEGRAEQIFKAGQWFSNSAYTPHDACSKDGFKTLSTYIVKRGGPVALPAP